MSDPRAGETLTIMVTDVEGSTALRRARGDGVADEILRLHEAIVRDEVARFGGKERKFLGDGFLLSFPNPPAAIQCAIAIQGAFEKHNAAEPERRVRVRIGIHSGSVRERDGELYGQTVHAAARVAAEAAAGQILVSDEVRKQAAGAGDFELVDSGLFWLKGFTERWRLYDVRWDGSAPVTKGVAVPPLTPFVERDAERARLRQSVKNALTGQGSLVLIAGEAGVGKSRLVTEIGGEAEIRGMRVLTGHCLEMYGAPPYLPYVEMIEQVALSPRSPLLLREALGDVAPEIARIAPALRRVFPDIAPPVELPPELARRYLWNSFGEFLGRAAERQPLLLILEDLHWADESTVLLTEYLAPLLPDLPVLILGTYRDDEVDISHPLSHLIRRLGRQRLVDRISLPPLSPDGVRAMVAALAGEAPPEKLVRLIDVETEGNPFFVEEVYLHLAESGVLLDELGHLRPDPHLEEISVPESIRLVIEGRLERLSDATRDALVIAAVSGRQITPDLVADVAGVGPDAIIGAFDEAERARLVTPAQDNGHLVFSHELIRQTLLSEISTVKRQRLHLRLADAMERRHADEIEAHAADLAHHLSRAGPLAVRQRLARYLTIAGNRAFDAAAYDDAVAHFRHALSLVQSTDARAELLERLAMALRSLGLWDDAIRVMNEALDVYEALERREAIGRLSWAMVYQLTWAARFAEAVQVAQRALVALGDIASADRARLMSAMAWAMSVGGDYESATATFDQARDIADQVENQRALADVLHMQTIHHMGYAEFFDGVRVGLAAAEVFEHEGALWDLCGVQAFVVYQDGTLGSREQANQLGGKTIRIAERLGHLGATFMLLADRVREAACFGDFGSVEALGPQIIEVCERGGLPWRYIGHIYIALAAHWRGDESKAEEEFRRAVALEPAAAFAGQSVSLLARHLAYSGKHDEVWDLLHSARPALPSLDRVNSIGAWNLMLGFVEALYVSGFRDAAAELFPLAEGALELGHDWLSLDCRWVRTRAGIAAAAGGRWDDAEHHYTVALEQAKQTRNRLETAEVQRLHARMLLERSGRGARARAAWLAGEALSAYRAFEMPAYAAEAERLLHEARGS